MVEIGLAIQHWPGKSEGCAKHSQRAESAIARGYGGMPPGKFLKLHTLRLNLNAFSKLYNYLYIYLYIHTYIYIYIYIYM